MLNNKIWIYRFSYCSYLNLERILKMMDTVQICMTEVLFYEWSIEYRHFGGVLCKFQV